MALIAFDDPSAAPAFNVPVLATSEEIGHFLDGRPDLQLIFSVTWHGWETENGVAKPIVSSLKFLQLGVKVYTLAGAPYKAHPIRLKASLVFADNYMEPPASADAPPLSGGHGGTEMQTDGQTCQMANFRLKISGDHISSKHGERRFRIKVESVTTDGYPSLMVVTDAFRAMTKLPESRRPKAHKAPRLSVPQHDGNDGGSVSDGDSLASPVGGARTLSEVERAHEHLDNQGLKQKLAELVQRVHQVEAHNQELFAENQQLKAQNQPLPA